MEVETPAISRFATTDPAIESLATRIMGRSRYLQTSPEFPMKRLLAAGSGDIFQICKVYRDNEVGRFHNPEFTLLEWYRLGFDHLQLIEEVIMLLGELAIEQGIALNVQQLSYCDLFQSELDLDPRTCEIEELEQRATELNLHPGCELPHDAWLDLLLSQAITEHFPPSRLSTIVDYPASQAALARLNPDERTAARFEMFWGRHELANGFWELTDAEEQRSRFERDNETRATRSQRRLPQDDNLLAAIASGLPDCAGVALGIDRLVMKLTRAEHIEEVLSFPEGQA